MKTETSKKNILMAKYCHSWKIYTKSKENRNIHNEKKYICHQNEKNRNIVKKKTKMVKSIIPEK